MLTLLLLVLLSGQSPATGSLRVKVTERVSEAPLDGVKVSAWRFGSEHDDHRQATTGPDGTALLDGLQPGHYVLRVASATHLSVESVFDLPGESVPEPVSVLAGRTVEVRFALLPGAVISGHVDKRGSGPVEAEVRLVKADGPPILGHSIRGSWGSVKTDHDGAFTLQGLYAGTYFVSARPSGQTGGDYNEVFHPGVVDFHRAQAVTVNPGAHVSLTLQMPLVPAATVTGRIAGNTTGRSELTTRPLDIDTGDVIESHIVPLARAGAFSYPLKSGVHGFLFTRKSADGSVISAGTAVVHVTDQPVKDPVVIAKMPATLSGRFVFNHNLEVAEDDGPSISLYAQGDDAGLRQGLTHHERGAGDAFRVTGIFGSHRVDAQAPRGWIVEGIILADGRNVLDSIIDFEPGKHYPDVRVLLSAAAATIEGRMDGVGPDRRRADQVIVFPVDNALWGIHRYVARGAIDDDGSFRVQSVTPGHEYFVAPCKWPCRSRSADLEALSRIATRIFVARPGMFAVDLGRN